MPHFSRACAAVAATTAAVAAALVAIWRRRRRWLAVARRYPHELLCDPRVRRSLLPYATASKLSETRATGRGRAAGRPLSSSDASRRRRGCLADHP